MTDYPPGAQSVDNRLAFVLSAAASFHRPGKDQLAVVATADPVAKRPENTLGTVTDLVVQMALFDRSPRADEAAAGSAPAADRSLIIAVGDRPSVTR